MLKLTPRQTEILALIKQSLETHGYPPTRAEIAQALGFKSFNSAEEHLRALARKGAIIMVPGTSRGIRLPNDASPPIESLEGQLPIVGQVAAGAPILATEHIEEHCPLPPDYFHPKADFLLRVKGTSMQQAGILDGDLLAVHATKEACNGQIVVVRLGDEVTVKRFQRQGERVQLLPENDAFAPVEVDLRDTDMVIEGLSVGVIRRQP